MLFRIASVAAATLCAAVLTVSVSRYAKPMYVRRARKLLNAAVMGENGHPQSDYYSFADGAVTIPVNWALIPTAYAWDLEVANQGEAYAMGGEGRGVRTRTMWDASNDMCSTRGSCSDGTSIEESSCLASSVWKDGGACYTDDDDDDELFDDDATTQEDCDQTWVVGGYCSNGKSMSVFDCLNCGTRWTINADGTVPDPPQTTMNPGNMADGGCGTWTETGYCEDGTSRTKASCESGGRWTPGSEEICRRIIRPEAGDRIVFTWKGKDSIYEMPSQKAYEQCDFTVVSRDPKGLNLPKGAPGERQAVVTEVGDALGLNTFYHAVTTTKGMRITTNTAESTYLVEPTNPQNMNENVAYPDPSTRANTGKGVGILSSPTCTQTEVPGNNADDTACKAVNDGTTGVTGPNFDERTYTAADLVTNIACIEVMKSQANTVSACTYTPKIYTPAYINAHKWRPITTPAKDAKAEVGDDDTLSTVAIPLPCAGEPQKCVYEMPADQSDGALTVHWGRPNKEPWRPTQDTVYQSNRKQNNLPYFDEKEHPGEVYGHGFHDCPPRYACIWGRSSPAVMFIPAAGSPLFMPFQIYYLASIANCHGGLKVVVEVNGANQPGLSTLLIALVGAASAVMAWAAF